MSRKRALALLAMGGLSLSLAAWSQDGVRGPASRAGEPAQPVAGESAGAARGKQVFDRWCWPCHGDGPGKPGTAALQALYHGQKPALLERRTDLTPELVKYYVRHGVTVMPFFRKTEIGDEDLDALASYLAQ